MSKAVAALVVVGVGVGAVLLLASTSKASQSAQKYGQGTTVQGGSGNIWLVARLLNPGPVMPGVNVMAVFDTTSSDPNQLAPVPQGGAGDVPVLLYAQNGNDRSTRVLVSTAFAESRQQGPEDLTTQKARADFGV